MNRLVKKQKKANPLFFHEPAIKYDRLLSENSGISSSNEMLNRDKDFSALQNSIKIDMLTRKLLDKEPSSKLKQKDRQNQQFDNTRKTEFYINERHRTTIKTNNTNIQYNLTIDRLSQEKNKLCNHSQLQLRILHEDYEELANKFYQTKSCKDGRHQMNKDSLLLLQKRLEEIKNKVSRMDCQRIQLNLYASSFKKTVNLKGSVLKFNGLLKEANNFSPINQEGSLLLSFKRNLQQDDSFSALKYSEDSFKNRKDKKLIKDAQIFKQTFESFNQSKVSNIAHKLSYKDKVIDSEQSEYHQDYFAIAKDQIGKFLLQQKNHFNMITNQGAKGQERCEKILDMMLYEIALQKVQRQQQYKNIVFQLDEQFINSCTIMQEMNEVRILSKLKYQQKVYQIRSSIKERISIEHRMRKEEQGSIVKMLFEVVQFLQ